jgi:phosphinothricin acetyltransferase
MQTRLATLSDGAAIRAVYAPYVENSTYTFEFEVPTIKEVCDRMTRHPRHLWLVAEESAEILGYAYAWPFEDREGYRFTVETSVFVRQDRIGGGVGRALYADLLAALKLKGFTTAVARIALPNLPSERLHEKLGSRRSPISNASATSSIAGSMSAIGSVHCRMPKGSSGTAGQRRRGSTTPGARWVEFHPCAPQILRATAHQNILEIRRRSCNKREIAEEIAPVLTCPKARARSALTQASLTLPSCL